MSDEQLLQGLKQGDESSFSEIYERYWQKLLGIAYHLIRDRDLAECIVQDVFVSLWNRRDTVEIA
ncbi:MAG: RNA polymerase sigma factor, partial [Sphingobacterium hotanense]